MARMIETHSSSSLPGKSYTIVDEAGTVLARILWAGIGAERYGLYLPAVSADGSACFRRADLPGAPFEGTEYPTADEAFLAFVGA